VGGEPYGSDELDPEWFAVDDVPLDEMWTTRDAVLPASARGGAGAAHLRVR
jgi:8-oxo-dGTP diphosphatase